PPTINPLSLHDALPICLRGLAISLCAVTALPLAARASSGDIKLPKILAWTAYDVGSTGYSQGVGMGSTFKNKLGVTVRILPGKRSEEHTSELQSRENLV